GQVIFPEHQSSRNNIRRGSTNRHMSVDLGNTASLSPPPAAHSDRRSSHRSGAARRPFFQAKSIMEYVQAGDAVGLEQFLSDMSPSERELAYAAEAGADGGRTPILVALKSGSLELIQSILKWLPEGQAGKLLTAKDDDEGRTVLMLAACSGDPDVFTAVASKLPRSSMLEHLSETCVRGNLIFAYAAKTGQAAMIEAVIAQVPLDEWAAAEALCAKNFLGETPLMQAAGAPEPGAFQAIAKLLTVNNLEEQLSLETEQGQTALTIATRAGNVSTWNAVASKMAAATVSRQLTSTDIYGETAVMLSVRSGSPAVFRSVIGRLSEDEVLTLLGTRNNLGQTPAQVAVACGADAVLTAMLRPAWISACLLNAPDESEAQLTALDLAARPPAKLGVIKCLLACGAIPTARVVQRLLRTCSEDGEAMASSHFKNNLLQMKNDINALVLSVLRHLPDTVEGFDRFSTPAAGNAAGTGAAKPKLGQKNNPTLTPAKLLVSKMSTFEEDHDGAVDEGNATAAAKLNLTSTIARGVTAASSGRLGAAAADLNDAPASEVGTTLVQEMLEPELAGLQPRDCAGPLAQAMR
ncbi:unnamed protein product, partial [Ectocarpus sp. 4 AP-2014]